MRVLAYTNLFPSTREPTRGIYNLQLFSALSQYCEVQVVCPVAWRNRLRSPLELIRWHSERHGGLETRYPTFVPIVRLAPRLNPWLMYQATRISVARTRKRFPFDVILAAWGYPDAVAALRLARQYRCPLVLNLLGSDMNDLANRPTIRDIVASTVRASQAIIVMSEVMAEDVVALGVPRSKVTVQHNGVDRERFRLRDKHELRASLGLPLHRPLVVFIGTLVPVKGPDVLVAAFTKLREDMASEAMLVIVGDGDMRRNLEHALERRGLLQHVRFMGRRLHTEIPDWISATDVVCLPSRTEGCPNVVLEALASGRPVVATRVGAVPDLLTQSTGRLVDMDDAKGLADALATSLATKWDAELIRASVAHLTWGSVAQTYFHVLERALKLESAA